jgi:hypothetical protein
MLHLSKLRLFVLIVASVLLLQAGGAASVAAIDDCAGSCPDDDPEGDCPPVCPSCTCVTHAHPPLLPPRETVALAVQTPTASSFAAVAMFVPSPDPREILHVPKALLA